MASFPRSVLAAMEADRDLSLLDLDKGLRSAKKGEQIEAVVTFPTLFDKNPFPIVVNAGCLKLADCFDSGDNFTRVSILTVLEQSRRHLDKIINVDEFLARIYKVVHSNDPVARAITLRALGACAIIFKDKVDVHHSIISALDSHDQIEVEAAVDAATKFSDQSSDFIINALAKIAAKIHTASIPMKIRFIPILQYTYRSEEATLKVRHLCTELLVSHPALDVVLPVLDTLTRLSTRSLFDVPAQLNLLLDTMQCDARRRVRAAALSHVATLARLAPHVTGANHVQILLTFAFASDDDAELRVAALDVLSSLASSCAANVFAGVTGLERLSDYHFHSCAMVCAKSVELSCKLAKANALAGTDVAVDSSELSDLVYAVESLIVLATAEKKNLALKVALECGALLAKCTAIDPIVETCIQAMHFMSDDFKVTVCKFLYQMLPHGIELIIEHMPAMIKQRQHCRADPNDSGRLLVSLWSLLFKASEQTGVAVVGDVSGSSLLQSSLLSCEGADYEPRGDNESEGTGCGWTVYRVARQAMRHGHASTAAQLLHSLLPQVSSEASHFFISGLLALCRASTGTSKNNGLYTPDVSGFDDQGLIASLGERICWSEKAYVAMRALSARSASTAASAPMSFDFHKQYATLYLSLLQAHNQLQSVSLAFWSCPPPATASAAGSEDSTTCKFLTSHVGRKLRNCEVEFEDVSERYRKLRQTMFDADCESLARIHWLQDSCSLVAHCLRSVLCDGNSGVADTAAAESVTFIGPLVSALQQGDLHELRTSFLAANRKANGSAGDGESHYAKNCIQSIQRLSASIVSKPLKLPRYLFQRLQATRLSINIQPQQKSVSEALLIHADTLLVLKVEGVVSCETKVCKPLRRVKSVRVKVVSHITGRPALAASASTSPHDFYAAAVKRADAEESTTMVQTAPLSNDYFSLQFLLSFPLVGTHSVHIGCVAIDDDGVDWTIGTSTTAGDAASVLIKSYRDHVKQTGSTQTKAVS